MEYMGNLEFPGRSHVALFSVNDLIYMAFRDPHKVDFKLIHIILLVLARRLNVLHRKVYVNMPGIKKVTSDVFIDEVKVHAKRLIPELSGRERRLRAEYERDNILVGRTRRSAPEIKSLATQDLYNNLAEQISLLEQRLNIINSEVPEWMDKHIPLTHPKAMLQLGARLEKSESQLTKLTASLFNIASTAGGFRAGTDESETAWGQKLIVGYVMVSQNLSRSKGPKAIEGHSSRTSDWETSDAGNSDSTRPIKGTSIKSAKPIKGTTVSKDTKVMMDSAVGFSEYDMNLKGASEPISKPILIQNIRSLRDTFLKDFDERAKRLNNTIKEIRKDFTMIADSMIDLKPIEDALEDIEQVTRNCFTRQNQLNKETLTLGLYQDELFDMQQTTEDAVSKMQEALANRKSDVGAINQLHQDMTYLYLDCQVLFRAQKDIGIQQRDYCKELKAMLKIVLALNKSKCSRQEFWEALESKVGLYDLNTFMSSVHFAANYGDLQRILATKVDKFQAREYTWQRQIDEIYVKFHDTVGKDQLEVVNADARNKTRQLLKKIDYYIDIIDPYKRVAEPERTRTRSEQKCLSCFSCFPGPFTTLSPEKETAETNTVCYPSKPVPKDKRCAKHMQPCQKHQEEEDFTAAMTVSAVRTNASIPKETHAIDTSNLKYVYIPCKPCNKLEYEYKSRDLPAQWSCK